jgi:putative ABC transport system permease protein
MKPGKAFKHALDMVLHSKLRSWLTILGIVIGVASVISIVSLGEGLQSTLLNQFGGLGADLITITPGASRGANFLRLGGPDEGPAGAFGGGGSQASSKNITLTKSDVQVVRGVPDISYIETEISGSVKASYLGKSGTVRVTGVDPAVWSKVTTLKTSSGRFLDAADQNVIVIGGRLASSYFGKPIGLNQMLTVGSSSYRVVGILNESSTSVYMPIQAAYSVIDSKTVGQYDSVILKAKSADTVDSVISAVTAKLMNSRHVTNRTIDFTVSSNQAVQQTRSSAMSSMATFLVALAAVSLIVGAIGIANTMFTSVLEKTKEIGIMKSVGAKNSDILAIFLMNAALIGLVGGCLGILLGAIFSGLLPTIIGGTPFIRSGGIISLNSVLMAVSVSVGAGVLAGIIPAYQASKLKPVDALRYE